MTLVQGPPTEDASATPPERPKGEPGSWFVNVLTTTDHKTIGIMYMVTSFAWFVFAGALAMIMRAELARPGLQLISNEQYNQLFTMHGTIMLLFFATSLAFGFANYIIPLQIGAPDVAFPRLNALGVLAVRLRRRHRRRRPFLTPDGAASFGWFAYAPLNSAIHSPTVGADLWIVGLAISGFGTILAAVNFITTIITMRAPGMTMFRMSIFTWNMLVTSILVLLAFPVLAAALLALLADRGLGAQIFNASTGGAILWQHLFWFFGHPEVYIIALPFFGIVSEVIPVFSRKPLVRLQGPGVRDHQHRGALPGGLGAPHVRHRCGAAAVLRLPQLPDRRPHRDQVLQLGRHHVAGLDHLRVRHAVRDRVPGHLPARRADRRHARQPAHRLPRLRHLLRGGALPLRGLRDGRVRRPSPACTFWWPKFTGRYLDERLGQAHFWATFIGFHLTFLVHHWLGAEGMPRRYADYLSTDGFTALNTVSTIGSFVLGASTLIFIYNMVISYRRGALAVEDDPWGHGNSLEWATTSPPPRHNFLTMPRIRSERPAFDLHFPQLAGRSEQHASPEVR